MAQMYYYTLILLTFLCLLFSHSFAAHFNTSTDESSLLAIKARITSDPNNFLTTNWSQGTSFCTWNGVICSRRHARVASLNLFNMSLQGTIAPDIGNLSFLTFLSFRYNSFTGPIPYEIGNLGRLRSLSMSLNQLSGNVPPSLGLLKNLERMTFEGNDLTGSIPWSIFNISSLRGIDFMGNRLSGSLPPIICPSAKLVGLALSHNQFVGEIPRGLSHCAELKLVSLSFNNFSGSLPVDIGKLSQLQMLYLARNQLSGTIPPSIGNLSHLEGLDLGNNNIEGAVPSEIGHLSSLALLSLSQNKLKGELPPSIFNLSRLQVLSLPMNELSGSFPRSIDKGLPILQFLYVGGNHKFTGEIPSSIVNISTLREFDIRENSFSGLIPINLGNLQHLRRIMLGDNSFTNDLSIPEQEFITSLTNCTNMNRLHIGGNPMTGVLPKSIGNLSTSLEYLTIENSGIRGTIPSEIGNLHNLVSLILCDNELTGEIPKTLGRLRNLQRLLIYGNKLQGTVPDIFCNMENLYRVDLSNNTLFGQLPMCLGNLSSLQQLWLYNNSFSSSIPSTLWLSRNLQEVILSHNLFYGSLSNEISNLRSLRMLYLDGNQLSGSIPITIGDLQSLTDLNIQNNKFNGSIPLSFGNLIALQYLDVSQNNLSGSIPNSLKTLMDLVYFNVSFNELIGEIPDGGHFQNFTAESFMKNKGLCGAPRFGVKACKKNALKSSRKNKLLRYVLPPVGSITVAVAIIIFLLGRRSKNSASSSLFDFSLGLQHERISYYELLRATSHLDEGNLIGKGSIGSVYKGTFSNEMTAAVKVFNLDVQSAFKSFDTECRIMRSLRHRNLVKVITSCSNLDFKALVMEYMPNGNLDKWLYNPNYPLKIDERLGIVIDVASAIEYLHHGYSLPVAHCDLKPSNILLDEDMGAHVADFGISKLLTEDQRMEQTKTLGTIGYMAPEYGSAGLVSTKVDIYSFGILLMETLTKKKPTDEMFLGELTMKGWVSESYPNTVMEIVDAELLNVERDRVEDILKKCLVSVMEVAIECAAELPEERPDMNDVLVRLKKIKVKLHNTGR